MNDVEKSVIVQIRKISFCLYNDKSILMKNRKDIAMTLTELIAAIKNETRDIDTFQVVILSQNKENDDVRIFNMAGIEEDGPDMNFVKSNFQKKSTFRFKGFFNKLLTLQEKYGDSDLYSAEYEKLDAAWNAHLDLPITGHAVNDEMQMFALLDFLPESEKK